MLTSLEKHGRGTAIAAGSVQEVLEASKNGGAGQSQFFTPPAFARTCARPLPQTRTYITDLSAGAGNLLLGTANDSTQLCFALDIENCRTVKVPGFKEIDVLRIAGDCTKIYPLLKEVNFSSDLFALNPPWSLKWYTKNLSKLAETDLETVRRCFPAAEETIDSTIATLMMALDLCTERGEGYLIANNSTLERLIFGLDAPFKMLATHIWARVVLLGNPMTGEAKQTFDKEKDFETGIIYFARSHCDGCQIVERCKDMTEFDAAIYGISAARMRVRAGVKVHQSYDILGGADELWKAVRNQWDIVQGKRRADYNIYMGTDGTIQTHLSVFDNKSIKIPKAEAVSLFNLNGKKALELVMMKNERQLLLHHVNAGIWRIHPDLPRQVNEAVNLYHAARAPLYPLNAIQSLGFVDESEQLECKIDVAFGEDVDPDLRKKIDAFVNRPNSRTWDAIAHNGVHGTGSTVWTLAARIDPDWYNSLDDCGLGKGPEGLTIRRKPTTASGAWASWPNAEKIARAFQTKSIIFRAGCSYKVETQTVNVMRTVEKPGVTGEMQEHFLRGQELAIWITDEQGVRRLFMDKRHSAQGVKIEGSEQQTMKGGYTYHTKTDLHPDFDLKTIVNHFDIPSAPDVAVCQSERYQEHLNKLDQLESTVGNGFKFRGFQRRDLARAAIHDGLILGADPGTGKTAMGIGYALLKVGLHPDYPKMLMPAAPVLIIAPEQLHRQMMFDYQELFGAAMPEVHELDCQETFLQMAAGGALAPGWYMSSFTQIATNKIKEMPEVPQEYELITEAALAELMAFYQVSIKDALAHQYTNPNGIAPSVHQRAANLCMRKYLQWSENIGVSNDEGIKCVFSPSLADLVRKAFKCVIIDEAVKIKAEDSLIGIGVRSLDPDFRAVLTGTPIKNRLPDIFYLAGWACNAMKAANARWPYDMNKEGELARFSQEFLVMGRNLTKERNEAEARGGTYRPPTDFNTGSKKQRRGVPTAEVCNVHRLWKLLAPVLLRRLKKDIGEDIVPKTKHLIYVPMGTEQSEVYKYHLQAQYKDKNGQPAIGAQLQALRNCAAAPHTELLCDKGKPHGLEENHPPGVAPYVYKSRSNYIPKLHACLTVIEEILRRREQVVVFSAFHEPLDTLSLYLTQAGIAHDVLDGRMSGAARGRLAMEFKRGLAGGAKPVLLCGNKAMAEGNSWNLCNNVILYSFDWALDLFLQAIDRVHRLNSKKPVNIYPIVCEGTIDKKLESMINEKSESSESVLDGQLMKQNIEEVNLAALLNIAHAEFSAENTIAESKCKLGWPDLCEKLSKANKELMVGFKKEQSIAAAKKVVTEAVRLPAARVLDLNLLPTFNLPTASAFR